MREDNMRDVGGFKHAISAGIRKSITETCARIEEARQRAVSAQSEMKGHVEHHLCDVVKGKERVLTAMGVSKKFSVVWC